MKYKIIYQDHDNGNPGVVSAFEETQNIGGSVGASWHPVDVELPKAKQLLEVAIEEGYRPTGDTTREILSK